MKMTILYGCAAFVLGGFLGMAYEGYQADKYSQWQSQMNDRNLASLNSCTQSLGQARITIETQNALIEQAHREPSAAPVIEALLRSLAR